jgi:hypothetical protein
VEKQRKHFACPLVRREQLAVLPGNGLHSAGLEKPAKIIAGEAVKSGFYEVSRGAVTPDEVLHTADVAEVALPGAREKKLPSRGGVFLCKKHPVVFTAGVEGAEQPRRTCSDDYGAVVVPHLSNIISQLSLTGRQSPGISRRVIFDNRG